MVRPRPACRTPAVVKLKHKLHFPSQGNLLTPAETSHVPAVIIETGAHSEMFTLLMCTGLRSFGTCCPWMALSHAAPTSTPAGATPTRPIRLTPPARSGCTGWW